MFVNPLLKQQTQTKHIPDVGYPRESKACLNLTSEENSPIISM